MAEREIAVEWIERTLDAPELIVPDPDDPAIERCFRRIPEFGGPVCRLLDQGFQVLIPRGIREELEVSDTYKLIRATPDSAIAKSKFLNDLRSLPCDGSTGASGLKIAPKLGHFA